MKHRAIEGWEPQRARRQERSRTWKRRGLRSSSIRSFGPIIPGGDCGVPGPLHNRTANQKAGTLLSSALERLFALNGGRGDPAREGPISRVGRARRENTAEAADRSGAQRRGAEGGSGPVERTEPGAASGPGPQSRARPVEEQPASKGKGQPRGERRGVSRNCETEPSCASSRKRPDGRQDRKARDCGAPQAPWAAGSLGASRRWRRRRRNSAGPVRRIGTIWRAFHRADHRIPRIVRAPQPRRRCQPNDAVLHLKACSQDSA